MSNSAEDTNIIEVSDGERMHAIQDMPDHRKHLSDEARVLINQIINARGFGKMSNEKQNHILVKMFEEGELAPHEVRMINDAMKPSTITMHAPVPSSEELERAA